jgi:hypothetical protein
MKFSFRIGVYLILATTIAMLVTLGGAYKLSVTEQVQQAGAEANSRRIFTKLEELVSAGAAVESAALNHLIGRAGPAAAAPGRGRLQDPPRAVGAIGIRRCCAEAAHGAARGSARCHVGPA